MNTRSQSADIRIAIFASRETTETLFKTILSTLEAAPQHAQIDVLVNGNEPLAETIRQTFHEDRIDCDANLRIWSIKTGDKANAWNQHIHHISRGCSASFYMDGYVRPESNAIKSLLERMDSSSDALGGTGIPSTGRGARSLKNQLLTEGGFHGNLCCIRANALDAMRSRDIRIPLGIYRTDSTMGAFLSFGLDPSQFSWNPRKYISVDPNSTWKTDDKHWWNYRDVISSLKRFARQTRGQIENQAVRAHLAVLRKPPELLPRTVKGLVEGWMTTFPVESNRFFDSHPLSRQVMRQLLQDKDWNESELLAKRL